MANVIGAGSSESLPRTAVSEPSQNLSPSTSWRWLHSLYSNREGRPDVSVHSWAVLSVLQPGSTTARAWRAVVSSLLLVVLQSAALHLVQYEVCFPACSTHSACPAGTTCTYHALSSGVRCVPCYVPRRNFLKKHRGCSFFEGLDLLEASMLVL